MERQKHSPSLVWPAILITAGILLLLNNLGLLSWGVWTTLLSLWPILLIAVGLDILVGRRSIWGSGLIALLLIAVFLGAAWFDTARGGEILATRQEGRNVVQQALGEAERGQVEIDFSVGKLRIDALQEGSGLLEGRIDLLAGERLTESYQQDGGTAKYRLGSTGRVGFAGLNLRAQEPMWDLELTREVPLDLTIRAGIGSSEVDLSRLTLTGLRVKNGIGEMKLTLPRSGEFAADVKGGIGEVTIIVPDGMSARIRGEAGLGRLDVSGQFVPVANGFESPGYASARDRVDIDVSGGIGQVSIVQRSAD